MSCTLLSYYYVHCQTVRTLPILEYMCNYTVRLPSIYETLRIEYFTPMINVYAWVPRCYVS